MTVSVLFTNISTFSKLPLVAACCRFPNDYGIHLTIGLLSPGKPTAVECCLFPSWDSFEPLIWRPANGLASPLHTATHFQLHRRHPMARFWLSVSTTVEWRCGIHPRCRR